MNGKIFCNQCGREAAPGATFCVQCGARFGAAASASGAMPSAAAPAMAPAAAYGGAIAYPAAPVAARYGGFWIRFVAFVIDAVLVWVVLMPVSIVLAGAMGAASALGRAPGVAASLAGALISMAVSAGGNWLYEALMESSAKQATLGKMIFGMKVTDLAGNRISFARATGRHFAKYISGMILLIGYIMAGFTEKKQALHDMLAGTLVRRP